MSEYKEVVLRTFGEWRGRQASDENVGYRLLEPEDPSDVVIWDQPIPADSPLDFLVYPIVGRGGGLPMRPRHFTATALRSLKRAGVFKLSDLEGVAGHHVRDLTGVGPSYLEWLVRAAELAGVEFDAPPLLSMSERVADLERRVALLENGRSE